MPNILRSKDNQWVKFSQLMEHNMRKNIPEKLYTKCGGETIPKPFYKSQNSAYLYINNNSLRFYTACFYYMLSQGLSKYIETKLKVTCFYLI